MEYIRAVKITIYIDTNKTTYEKSFEDIDKAKEYCDSIVENIQR